MNQRVPNKRSLKARALQWLSQREYSRSELRRRLFPYAVAEVGLAEACSEEAEAIGSDAVNIDCWRSDAADVGSIGVGSFGTEPVSAESVCIGSIGTESFGIKSLGAEPFGIESIDAKTFGVESVGADPLGADSLGAESLGADSLGADSLSADSLSADSLSADSRGSHIVGATHSAGRRSVVPNSTPAGSSRSVGCDSAEDRVDAVLAWLEARHYLSDQRFVESRVHARAGRYGNLRIREELKSHGVALPAELAQSLRLSELGRAGEVREKKFGAWPADARERARQARFLAGRGFSSEVIQRLLRRSAPEVLEGGPGE